MNDHDVLTKIKKLCVKHGTSKAKLGELLTARMGNETAKYMTYYKRGDLFLEGRGAIKAADLKRIADYFNVSLSYFMGENSPEDRIRSGLSELGLSDDQVKMMMKQIEAII